MKKNKTASIISIMFPTAALILILLSLILPAKKQLFMPIGVICMGMLELYFGISALKHERKSNGRVLIVISLLLFVDAFLMLS